MPRVGWMMVLVTCSAALSGCTANDPVESSNPEAGEGGTGDEGGTSDEGATSDAGGMGDDPSTGDSPVRFERNEETDRLVVSAADGGFTYGAFSLAVTDSSGGVRYTLNGDPGPGTCLLTTTPTAMAERGSCSSPSAATVQVGQFIDLCHSGEEMYIPNVGVIVARVETGQEVARFIFASMIACK